MSSDSIPVGLQTLLQKHYYLAQISRGHKPNFADMSLIESDSWWGWFKRSWYYKESRKTVMPNIEKIISETIDAISIHKNKPDFLKLIINALAATRVGIESMTVTYRKDPEMIGKLKVQLNNIDLQLDKYRNLIKGYEDDPSSVAVSEKIIDSVVEGSDVQNKEELKKFLSTKTDNTDLAKSMEKRRRRHRIKQSTDDTENTDNQ